MNKILRQKRRNHTIIVIIDNGKQVFQQRIVKIAAKYVLLPYFPVSRNGISDKRYPIPAKIVSAKIIVTLLFDELQLFVYMCFLSNCL